MPKNIERSASYSLTDPLTTSLGQLFAARDESSFLPILAGSAAYELRASLAALSERTLDLQYYIWEDDLSGRMLLHDVLHAAERGIRVRILLDDVHTEGTTDVFHVVDSHPNVEVRLFNPFPRNAIRTSGLLIEGMHLNHRMHNKVMIADNAVGITGGRNIGDHYFAVDESTNFRDLDLLVSGTVVDALSGMFDDYWNSRWAYPVDALDEADYSARDARGYLAFLERLLDERGELPFPLHEGPRSHRDRLVSARAKQMPGRAEVVFDSPGKVDGNGGNEVAQMLFDSADGVRRELLIETAYFIPSDAGVEILGSLEERGVAVRVLTNSLATNDITMAHAAYLPYREDLLRKGVQLYELRPDALADGQRRRLFSTLSRATLHTKALVYDRERVFLGSFNLDPRSIVLNTEVGLWIESAPLASEIAEIILMGMRPDNSYRLVLRNGDLSWVRRDGTEVRFLDSEPETGWWQRFLVKMMSFMPIEDQL